MAATTYGVLSIHRTTIGQKAIMAVTGAVMVGFVVFHMVGNLKVFFGPKEINDYGHFLREVGYPLVPKESLLWFARVVLLGSVVGHIWSAIALTRRDLMSRPVGYVQHKRQASSYASRTARWGGVIITLYIVYHIAHLTLGRFHPNFEYGNVYNNLVIGFSDPLVVAIYVVANAFVAFHVYHGFWSMFQTLGLNRKSTDGAIRMLARGIGLALLVGNLSMPIALYLGVMRPQ